MGMANLVMKKACLSSNKDIVLLYAIRSDQNYLRDDFKSFRKEPVEPAERKSEVSEEDQKESSGWKTKMWQVRSRTRL